MNLTFLLKKDTTIQLTSNERYEEQQNYKKNDQQSISDKITFTHYTSPLASQLLILNNNHKHYTRWNLIILLEFTHIYSWYHIYYSQWSFYRIPCLPSSQEDYYQQDFVCNEWSWTDVNQGVSMSLYNNILLLYPIYMNLRNLKEIKKSII